jgi:hypothetical protein
VTDGSEWCQTFVDFHRRDALRILDFPHAGEYVSQIGRAVFGDGTPTTATWLTSQLHHLKHDVPTSVLAEARQLAVAHPDLAELPKHLAYLEKREPQMQYPTFQSAGWPIGDGAVESGNKLVVEARLKGSGMRWARPHVDPHAGPVEYRLQRPLGRSLAADHPRVAPAGGSAPPRVVAKAENTLRGVAAGTGNNPRRGENAHAVPSRERGHAHHPRELARTDPCASAHDQGAVPSRRQSSMATYAHRPCSLQAADKTRQRKNLNRTQRQIAY